MFARVVRAEGADSEGSPPQNGITAFLVERDSEGLSVGPPEAKVGLKASSTTPLFLKDCFVADDNVLGKVGKGRRLAMALLNEGRIGIAAQLVGVGQAALDLAVSYAKQREAFGRPIGKNQAVAFSARGGRARGRNGAAAHLERRAARRPGERDPLRRRHGEADRPADGGVRYVTGYRDPRRDRVHDSDCLAEKLWRDAKAGTIYEGTENMQLTTIAHGLDL